MDVDKYFPVRPSFSFADKVRFISLLGKVGGHQEFNYLEVGSFLGGSLSLPLIYKPVKKVVSIDTRPLTSPDERGILCNYGISTDQMKLNLVRSGVLLDKLETFDGLISDFNTNDRFQFIFLDGEHTDESTFRDAIYALKLLDESGIIAFHDSSLIHKSISNFLTLTESLSLKCLMNIDSASDIAAVAFGSFVDLFASDFERNQRPFAEFKISSERSLRDARAGRPG